MMIKKLINFIKDCIENKTAYLTADEKAKIVESIKETNKGRAKLTDVDRSHRSYRDDKSSHDEEKLLEDPRCSTCNTNRITVWGPITIQGQRCLRITCHNCNMYKRIRHNGGTKQ